MKKYKKFTFSSEFQKFNQNSYKLFDTKHDLTIGCDFGDHLGLHSDKVLEGYVSRRNMHRSIAYIYTTLSSSFLVLLENDYQGRLELQSVKVAAVVVKKKQQSLTGFIYRYLLSLALRGLLPLCCVWP